jgi:hypothetical protein
MTDKNETQSLPTPTLPTLTLDVALYQHYLDDSDLSDAQKQELLETLWTLICEFVFLGFGVSSTQLIQDRCGQDHKLSTTNLKTPSIALDSLSQGAVFDPLPQQQKPPENELGNT